MTIITNSIQCDVLRTKETLRYLLRDLDWKVKIKGKVNGLSTGYTELDSILGGLHGGKLYCLAARPAMGKTAFALNISLHSALKLKKETLIFSLEESTQMILARLLSIDTMIDSCAFKTGELTDSDLEKVEHAVGTISSAPLVVVDDIFDIDGIEEKSKEYFKYNKDGLIVIDYLQLITEGNKSGSENRKHIGCIVRRLNLLAKKLNIPIIVLSEISHAMENRKNKHPLLCDFRELDVVKFSDVVLFIYRDDYYNPDSEKSGVAEIIVAKNNDGPCGLVELAWIGKCQKYANLDKLANSRYQ